MGVYQRISDMGKWKRIALIVVCIFGLFLIGAVHKHRGSISDLSDTQKASILAIAEAEMGTEGTLTALEKAQTLRTWDGEYTITNVYYNGTDGDALLTIDLDSEQVIQRIERRGWMAHDKYRAYDRSRKVKQGSPGQPPIPALLLDRRHRGSGGPIIPLVVLVVLAYGIDWLFFSRKVEEEFDRDEESDNVIISEEKEALSEDEEPEEEPVKKKKKKKK